MRWLAMLGMFLFVACAGGAGPVSQGIGEAAGCQRDSECPAGYYCVRGGCEALPQSCTTSADCQGGDVCQQGYCLVPSGSAGGTSPGTTGGSSATGGTDSGGTTGSGAGTSGGSSGGGSGWGGLGGGTSASYCQSCTNSSQCGGSGNFCLQDTGDSGTYCGVACNTNADCPAGATCWAITDSQTGSTVGHACFPTAGSCQQAGGGSTTGGSTGGSTTGGSGAGGSTGGSGTSGGGTGTGGGSGSGSTGGSSACTTDTWSNYAGGFFDNYCAQCHSGEYDSNNYQNVSANESRIASYISSGRMPQGTRLSSSEKSRILKWLSCGAPQ